ncbi:hypothetical protein GCM10017673_13620 [Streptosporangium violaceochromogenes]|nr:hypothetical protein GCM10017673_13620 [Streptosporangium violaceochromogenes]
MYGTPSAWRVPGYTEIRELGAGAGGRVVMARHDADDVLVAIKYLSDEVRNDVGFVARFRHEARVLNTLDSPHAVRFYDYIETGEGAAIVMELIDGVALRAILRSEGPTGPEAALVVLKGALLGLSSAHAAGVVHRDFKPENVMVEADGTSKLVDFGIAVRAGDGNAPAGTPPYMAPEQWAGAPAGPSTDVYAATAVFFECLTGTRPFRAPNLAALARQHQVVPPPIEEVPPPLQGLVERGLAKHAADRPPTAAAFLTELEAVAVAAYGPDWSERGHRRLAGLAALLGGLFPLRPPQPDADTSLAETTLGGHRGASALSRTGVKLLVGVGCVAVIGGLTAVLVGSGGGTDIKAQSLITTQSPLSSEPIQTIIPGEETDEPTAEPSADPSQEGPAEPPPTSAPPAPQVTTAPPVVPPTRKPAPPPKPSAPPTAKPTKKPKPTKPPAPTPTDEGSSPLGRPDFPPSKPPSATPTPTPTRTPTQSPPPTATPSTSPPTTPRPSPTPSGGESPTLTATPTPPEETPPPVILTLGLMTGGAVPFTLVLRRGLAGRHRRRR